MPNQRVEVGNQSLTNLKAGHLAWYLLSGRSQGFVLEIKNTPTFQNTLFVRQALVNIEYAN